MTKPTMHILVCGSFRASGAPQGVCSKNGSQGLLAYLEAELADRGMDGVSVTATGCLHACDRGPILVVYPDNLWYGGVESEEAIDVILDSLESGNAAVGYELR
jgi:(2Fe-2S) ferredoxin